MKKSRAVVIALILTLVTGVITMNAEGRNDLKRKSILVFCGYGKGYVHDNIVASADMVVRIADKYGIVADTTSSKECFADENLERYDAIVYANASYVVLNDSQRRAFERFVTRGGGFVGIHAAASTLNDWPWFTRLIGGCFDFHPPFQTIHVEVIEPSHPSMKGVKTQFTTEDELYTCTHLNPKSKILAVSRYDGVKPAERELDRTFGDCFPSVWCNDSEGGRSWYTAYGHAVEDCSKEWYENHVEQGLLWVLGK